MNLRSKEFRDCLGYFATRFDIKLQNYYDTIYVHAAVYIWQSDPKVAEKDDEIYIQAAFIPLEITKP